MASLRISTRVLTRKTLPRTMAARSFTTSRAVQSEKTHADPTPESDAGKLVSSHLPYMVATYSRPPPIFTHGLGSTLYDTTSRPFLDFTSGIAVNSLGHCDPQITTLISDQASKLIHCSNLYHNPWTGELSKLLVEKTKEFGGMQAAARSFICNSGSEANEAAIKFARKVGKVRGGEKKTGVVSFRNSFHGRTMGSLSATPNPKYQKPFGPMVPGFTYGDYNDIPGLATLITEETCGVIVEPIQGEGGVYVGSDEFFVALKKRCTEVGAVLIYDEIQCGVGRTGSLWAHAQLPQEAHPDILTMAKALGNGFPIGAVVVTEAVAKDIVVGDHGTTFGGNPLASRIGHHVMGRIANKEFLEAVNAKSETFKAGLQKIQKAFPEHVKEVRGKGLILGLQMGDEVDLVKVVGEARERGLLVITAGKQTLRFVPPLVIKDDEINKGLEILEEAIGAVVNA